MAILTEKKKAPKRTEGARLLRAYLDANRLSVAAFATLAGVDRITIFRTFSGERWDRITVNFAHRVAEATGGAIPIEAWLPTTARKVRAGKAA